MTISRIILVIAAVFASLGAAPALTVDTVYVTRHLPKAEGQDPPLTAVGAAQAEQLAVLFQASNIKAIFATATRRAQQTGEPWRHGWGLV